MNLLMTPKSSSTPHGERLLPVLIDEIATSIPDKVFACIPTTSNLKDGFHTVTFSAFARAINKTARWIEEILGQSDTFETLTYFGPPDIRYFILINAATKVGYQTLLPSPRNSLEGQIFLFEKTKCKAIITAEGFPLSTELLSYAREKDIPIFHLDDLSNLLAEGQVLQYHLKKTFQQAKSDPYMILHTSGSTGLPKPIFLKHGWVAAMDSVNILPHSGAYKPLLLHWKGSRMFNSIPPFHSFGIILGMLSPVFLDSNIVWGPPDQPISTVLIDEVLDNTPLDIMYLPPSVLEDAIYDSATREKLVKLKGIGYGGGSLSQKAGDLISKQTLLLNTLGSTEVSCMPIFTCPSNLWSSFHYNPSLKGIQFRPLNDTTFEQVLVRHPSTDAFTSIWSTFPEQEEYFMNDLYTPHPTEPNFWTYVGRKDDLIVLSNGEKVNPFAMESMIYGHPDIQGVLVVGHGRFAIAAIIEINPETRQEIDESKEKKTKFIEEVVLGKVVEANKVMPTYGQLARDMIILSNPKKAFPRAGKGTIQRHAAVKLYEMEVEGVYNHSEENFNSSEDLEKIDVTSKNNDLEKAVARLIGGVVKVADLNIKKDVFASGMDSLHVMTVVKHLKMVLMNVPIEKINSRLIYSNPTISGLVSALRGISKTAETANGISNSKSRGQNMEEILKHYIEQLPPPCTGLKSTQPPSDRISVLLTGTTSSLGSYLLHSLLTSPKISKVYCLNRTDDAAQRQAKISFSNGLVSKFAHGAEFLRADLSKPYIGLTQNNQWEVDFNLSLSSFTPHMEGVLNLVKLSSASPKNPPIFFTSSISTVFNWPQYHLLIPVPEAEVKDPRFSASQGYAESKWISEQLFHAASMKSGVSSAILRIGQIAGPVEFGTKGVWKKREWIPSIIASSKYLGCIPNTLPGQQEVQWIPVDLLSGIICDLAIGSLTFENEDMVAWTRYYHLMNPNEGNWGELVGVIREYFQKKNTGGKLELVSFEDWVSRLQASGKGNNADQENNPGLKLLDFYTDLVERERSVKFDTGRACEASEGMRNLEKVNEGWTKSWLEGWAF